MKNGRLTKFIQTHLYTILLVAIIALAAFFRFYQLNHLPPGLHPDEAANGLDIFRILEHHDIRPLYNTNGPRESLFFFLQAIFVAILGNTILALRIAPALIGVAAVFTTYLWAKSWFGARVGLLAAVIMAVNPWAVTITRDGFRASMTPLFVSLVAYLYTRAFQTKSKRWFIAAGATMGLGMYTYLSFRLFPVALAAIWLALEIWRRDFIKPFRKSIIASLIAFAILMIPMGLYGIKHPGDLGARASGTSFLNKDLNGGHPVQTLASNIAKTALMFNVHGDENYRQNLGGQPLLNIFVGVMFILGILICLVHFNRPRYYGLIFIFGAMLVPEVLTAEGIPHALRSIGALPAAVILAALGIEYMLERWYATFPINAAARYSGLAIILVLIGLTIYQGYTQYFVAWANSPQTYEAYSEDSVALAKYMLAHPFTGERYAVVDGYSDKTVYYLTHNHLSYTRIDPSQIAGLPVDGQPKQFVIVRSQYDAAIKPLRDHWAGGKLSPGYSTFNASEIYDVYEVTK
ncbi:MAG TPA: glycosyltransferase family 39 protein [Candidatus Saccharimonadales bacterium]|nr:glycosyltransferase family 39 protein [Candidatus Saccharimonadales bacterium]